MSTKIYTAYLYTGTIFELIELLKVVRAAQIEECKKRIIQWGKMYNIEPGKSSWISINRILLALVSSQLNDPLNFDASIVVCPHEEKIALIPFGVHREIFHLISKNEKCINYAYWDNVDQPESIPDDEWEDRAKFYDSLDLSNDPFGSFSSMGFVYELWSKDICTQLSIDMSRGTYKAVEVEKCN